MFVEERIADRFDVAVDSQVFSVDRDFGKAHSRGRDARFVEEVVGEILAAQRTVLIVVVERETI